MRLSETVTYCALARQAIISGLPEGPLTGVPFLLKDLSFAMKGVECSQGSRLFAGYEARANSTAVSRYLRSGLVIFGRTRSPEFGIMPATESALYGITRNPWKLDRTAGGCPSQKLRPRCQIRTYVTWKNGDFTSA